MSIFISDEDFIAAVKSSTSIRESLLKLELAGAGANYKQFKKRCAALQLDISHFTGQSHSKNLGKEPKKKVCLDEILVENYQGGNSTSKLKKKLIKQNMLIERCEECDLGPVWNNKKLIFHLDHINGINNDNRIENLRLLCPNCHSQTSTYAGKNIKKKEYTKVCKTCATTIKNDRVYCRPCFEQTQYKFIKTENPKPKTPKIKIVFKENKIPKLRKTKIVWPSNEELKEMVWREPSSKLSKMLGVSDKAIEKRCKKFDISKPPRGYWEKLYHSIDGVGGT